MEMAQADVVDRLTILELRQEHNLPANDLPRFQAACKAPRYLVDQMKQINRDGWAAVEIVTNHFEGKCSVLEYDLIQACRAAHVSNRQRIALKNKISKMFDEPQEPKTWARDNGSVLRASEVATDA